MSRKKRPDEIICHCSAYKFPHRLGGGACTGTEWCSSYKTLIKEECHTCPNFDSSVDTCDVIQGREELSTCAAIEDVILRGIDPNLPQSEEEFFSAQYNN